MQISTPRPREQALEQILAYILTNGLKAGDRLPSEREMCRMWGFNRCTLRSAIAALEKSGNLYAVQGSGTCVAPKYSRTLQNLQGISEYAADSGLNSEARLLSVSQVECDKQLSRCLRLSLGQKTYRISRLRLLNGVPVMIETSYIPVSLAPQLEENDLVRGSLYALLRDVYGLELDHGEEKISITTASEEEALYLGIEPGEHVFWISEIAETADGTPAEFCRTIARGDKIELTCTLRRRESEGANNE